MPGVRTPFPVRGHHKWVVDLWQGAARYLHSESAAHRTTRK